MFNPQNAPMTLRSVQLVRGDVNSIAPTVKEQVAALQILAQVNALRTS